MPTHELFIYILFVIGFALTPGPNMMLYLTYTFEYGRMAGWATAAGIVSAFVVHITAIILGLTALLFAIPNALEIVRYCGIAYLFYMAIRNLKTVSWKEPKTAIYSHSVFALCGDQLLDSEQTLLLDFAEKCVIWAGRYPTPKWTREDLKRYYDVSSYFIDGVEHIDATDLPTVASKPRILKLGELYEHIQAAWLALP